MKKETIYNLPIFVTEDIPKEEDGTSRLYLMDMDKIEYSYCDCILYDRNGNPNCSIHQGKLQEFFSKSKVMYTPSNKYHLIKDGKPYCNNNGIREIDWLITEEYVTCGNCLKCERKDKEREIEAYQTIDKLDDDKKGFFYTFAELQLEPHKVCKIKELK